MSNFGTISIQLAVCKEKVYTDLLKDKVVYRDFQFFLQNKILQMILLRRIL
jgi:hypothetical protein